MKMSPDTSKPIQFSILNSYGSSCIAISFEEAVGVAARAAMRVNTQPWPTVGAPGMRRNFIMNS